MKTEIEHDMSSVHAQAEALLHKPAWPAPRPIEGHLPPVPAFDANTLLSNALRVWIMDEAGRMPCPTEFVAAAVLVAAGAVIGTRCGIKPKALDSWLIVPNLWGGVVGPPSAKKSPAISAALAPLDSLIAQAKAEYAGALDSFAAQEVVQKARLEALEGRIKASAKDSKKANELDDLAMALQRQRQVIPKKPTLRRFKCEDATVEKLGELLVENPAGLLVKRDELVGLLAAWDKEGREGDRAFFLEAWNGTGSFDTDRIGRGTIFVENLCVSVFGGIQPDKLTGYLEQAAHALANDGMLQRFQVLVYPNHREWEWRDRKPDRSARDKAFAVFDNLANINPQEWGASPADGQTRFPYLHFSEAAQRVFIEWSEDLHLNRMKTAGHVLIEQHLAKYDKLFPAIALIMHLLDCAAGDAHGPVSAEAALRAGAWCEYLEAHARRCYGLVVDHGLRAARALAEKLRQGTLHSGFTAREVRRNQWRSLTTDESVKAALEWLEDECWLRPEPCGGTGPGGGRRTERYVINPAVLSAGNVGNHDAQLT